MRGGVSKAGTAMLTLNQLCSRLAHSRAGLIAGAAGRNITCFLKYVVYHRRQASRSLDLGQIEGASAPLSEQGRTPQNSKRNANCMKRGVVSVERYLPNCLGS